MSRPERSAPVRAVAVAAVALAAGIALGGCGQVSSGTRAAPGQIRVVAAENQYGDVAAQVGGRYVSVSSIESSPNTDPHSYEVSPGVAREVGQAQVLVQNGVGYDDYVAKIATASPSSSRRVINAQHLLGLPDSTPNPHLWYAPATMPRVAAALAAAYARLQPAHAPYFQAGAVRFDASLRPWLNAIAQFKARYGGTPVATTEPVADYLLQAAGANNLTPFSFQADIMNGTDPSPQGVAAQNALLGQHRVRVLVHNQQVTGPITEGFVRAARSAGIPVVGAYETMPPGLHYQSWMLAEVRALQEALAQGTSTSSLG